jgi:hypothetical protein
MANEDNLRPVRSESEAREKGRNGGIASGEARRRKKTMREALEMLLYHGNVPEMTKEIMRAEGIDDEEMTHQMVITRSLIAKAESGDVQAYNAICQMIGEKPADNLNIGGVPTELHITMKGDPDYKFPSSESELDLTREGNS